MFKVVALMCALAAQQACTARTPVDWRPGQDAPACLTSPCDGSPGDSQSANPGDGMKVGAGDETLVDCASQSPACSDGVSCGQSADCESGYCNPNGLCSTPSCSDTFLNQDEVAVDCEGSCPYVCNICSTQSEIPILECEALAALHRHTDGVHWKDEAGWRVSDTPCAWYGVTCLGGHVTEIDLTRNDLDGNLPPELGDLGSLVVLKLSFNLVNGSVPVELGNLRNLEVMSFRSNNISGPLPAELGNISPLRTLSFQDNALTGGIPAALGSLTELTALSLASNELTGALPIELTGLIKLTYLALGNNRLTGNIPPGLGNLVLLNSLQLAGNDLTGPIPATLGNLVEVKTFLLNRNALTGVIPPELGALIHVLDFNVSSNQLTGPVPAEFTAFAELRNLTLLGNQLTRFEPNVIATMTMIRSIDISLNGMDQNGVDDALQQIYDGRAGFMFATPRFSAGTFRGSNSAPSGAATDPLLEPGSGLSNTDWAWAGSCHTPLSGTAMAYALAHDLCGEGFNLWSAATMP